MYTFNTFSCRLLYLVLVFGRRSNKVMVSKLKKLLNTGRNHPVNFIYNNIVDEDVQSILLPLNLMQYLILCPKYRIRNHLITPNSFISNFVSAVGILLLISIFTHRGFVLFSDKDNSAILFSSDTTSFCFDSIYYCLGFTLNFVFGIVHSKKNIKFVLTFQQVHRFLNCEKLSKRFIMCSWISTILNFLCYMSLFAYFMVRLRLPLYLMCCAPYVYEL